MSPPITKVGSGLISNLGGAIKTTSVTNIFALELEKINNIFQSSLTILIKSLNDLFNASGCTDLNYLYAIPDDINALTTNTTDAVYQCLNDVIGVSSINSDFEANREIQKCVEEHPLTALLCYSNVKFLI